MLGNVSSLVNVKWYLGKWLCCDHKIPCTDLQRLGIPFNDTSHLRLEIAEHGEEILGDNLIGFQAGNEPDLYGAYVLSAPIRTSFLSHARWRPKV